MPKLIMMSAPSASGKSTLARELMAKDYKMVRINRDELRAMSALRYLPSNEEWIIDAEIALAKTAGALKKNIIIDDTNLTARDELRWKSIATSLEYTFEKKVLSVSLEECIKRDALRSGKAKIGSAAIERQFLRAGLWTIPAGKKTVIFDIDGTVADLTHRIPWITIGVWCPNCSIEGRPSYASRGMGFSPEGFDDWANGNWDCQYCGQPGGDSGDNSKRKLTKKRYDMFYGLVEYDPPIDIVVKWVQACYPEYYILFVSGRSPENNCDEKTRKWLTAQKIQYDHLLMRRSNVHGPDTDEKQLILNDILKVIPKEDIAFVVDDRPSVIQMWRDNGLRVIPVRGRDDDKFYTEVKKTNV